VIYVYSCGNWNDDRERTQSETGRSINGERAAAVVGGAATETGMRDRKVDQWRKSSSCCWWSSDRDRKVDQWRMSSSYCGWSSGRERGERQSINGERAAAVVIVMLHV
jgi:hypothetical protein